MLERTDYFDKRQSEYSCDMCGEKLNAKSRYVIYGSEKDVVRTRKLYDLCEHCYNLMVKGVAVYKKRRGKTSGESK